MRVDQYRFLDILLLIRQNSLLQICVWTCLPNFCELQNLSANMRPPSKEEAGEEFVEHGRGRGRGRPGPDTIQAWGLHISARDVWS